MKAKYLFPLGVLGLLVLLSSVEMEKNKEKDKVKRGEKVT